MNVVKIKVPLNILVLSSLSLMSCSNKQQIIEQPQKTEIVTLQQPKGSFEKQADKKNDIPWWSEVLIGSGVIFGLFSICLSRTENEVEEIKNDPAHARTFLEMNGDYYNSDN